MSTPYQPIPETTQVHVDRLVGSTVGAYRVVRHVTEGRYGTIYRCEHLETGAPTTLEVLRTQLKGNDQDARAANAIKSPGVATVTGFGDLPDGRHWRMMELLDGESLGQLIARRGPIPPAEVVSILERVATVLEASHAWAIVHGSLGATNVFLVKDSVKLTDFGLARERLTAAADLRALGWLGTALLAGEDAADGRRAPPGTSGIAPVLRALIDGQLATATIARKALLDSVAAAVSPPPVAKSKLPLALGVAVLLVVLIGAGLAFIPREAPALTDDEATMLDDEDPSAAEEPQLAPPTTLEPVPVIEKPVRPSRPRLGSARPVPEAAELQVLINSLERRLQKRGTGDVDQALSVLNKQRLRLTGSPTLNERRDVVRQLAGWRRSYLR
ncbi:MAG: protein kinase [Archangiaceae bacterium]|nr:protein kinase [Archangiaceae bacterium]